jgi:glucose/arabinose dehydrogenase
LDPGALPGDQVNSRLEVPEGYGVSLFAAGIPGARMLRVTSAGDVLVATARDGRIILLEADRNGDGVADGQRVVLEGLNNPNGLELAAGYLYVGEEDGIGRIIFDASSGTVEGSYERIVDGLPRGGNHWRKTIRLGPDGFLYLAIGSSCNVCVEGDNRRAALLRYTLEGEFVGIYATGLRNSAGFDWSPDTGVLYATDNGRDLLGDDFPPCELNEIVEGGFYGWPFANGARHPDPDLGAGRDEEIAASIAPVHDFRAHNAPLGIAFLRSENHPPPYRNAAIVALHGSWNRSVKDGYKVVSLHFAADGTITERDFFGGFLRDGEVLGRPSEVAEGPDGSVYISDDYGGAVYRIRYGGTDVAAGALSARPRSEGYDPSAVSDAEREAALQLGTALLQSSGCLACHVGSAGQVGASEGLQVLDGLADRYTLEELMSYLSMPNPPMPPFVGDDAQRRALAVYLLETL